MIVATDLWNFLIHPDMEPTSSTVVEEVFSAGVRALRLAVITRKMSYGAQSHRGPL